MKVRQNKSVWLAISILVASGLALFFGIPYMWNQPVREVRRIQKSLYVKERLSAREVAELVDKKRNTLVSTIGTGATIIGGIVLLINAYLATKTLNLNTAQFKVNNRKIEDDRKLTESRLISERFAKAIEQLGNKNIHIRLGGIYSLEKIAQDSQDDHWPVIAILTAFIRAESPRKWRREEDPELNCPEDDFRSLPTIIQAAATVISHIKTWKTSVKLHNEEKIDLSNTELGGVEWNKANLNGGNLAAGSLVNASLRSASLIKANLYNTELRRANLRGANLSNAYLKRTSLSLADLSGANLTETKLMDATLRQSELVGANLKGADLSGASLVGANLRDANLSGASLVGANLRGANLQDTNLSSVDLRSTKGLDEKQASRACLCQTTLPKGIELDSNRDCKKRGLTTPNNLTKQE